METIEDVDGLAEVFLVIKHADVVHYLNADQIREFNKILKVIGEGRNADGKKGSRYMVINTDEPYAEQVADILKQNGHWGSK